MIPKFLLVTSMILMSSAAWADRCPTPQEVSKRGISRDYDWAVSEDVTLDMLLEVSELHKVSLHNHGEFVSCHYYSRQLPVRMDGAAPARHCLIGQASGEWLSLPGGELGCLEKTPEKCQFYIECHGKADQ